MFSKFVTLPAWQPARKYHSWQHFYWQAKEKWANYAAASLGHVRPGNWRMIQVMKDSRYNWASWEGIKSRMMSNLFFFNSWCYYIKSSKHKWNKRRIIFHGDTDGKCFVYIQLTKVIFKKKKLWIIVTQNYGIASKYKGQTFKGCVKKKKKKEVCVCENQEVMSTLEEILLRCNYMGRTVNMKWTEKRSNYNIICYCSFSLSTVSNDHSKNPRLKYLCFILVHLQI